MNKRDALMLAATAVRHLDKFPEIKKILSGIDNDIQMLLQKRIQISEEIAKEKQRTAKYPRLLEELDEQIDEAMLNLGLMAAIENGIYFGDRRAISKFKKALSHYRSLLSRHEQLKRKYREETTRLRELERLREEIEDEIEELRTRKTRMLRELSADLEWLAMTQGGEK